MSSLAFFILGVVVLYLFIGACFVWSARGGYWSGFTFVTGDPVRPEGDGDD